VQESAISYSGAGGVNVSFNEQRINCSLAAYELGVNINYGMFGDDVQNFYHTLRIPKRWSSHLNSYYWRHSGVHQSEDSLAALCTRDFERKRVLVTFGDLTLSGLGDKSRITRAKNMTVTAMSQGHVQEAYAFTLKDVPSEIITKYRTFFQDKRVFNMFAKVYFIDKTVRQQPTGTIIIWIDSDMEFKNLDIFECLARNVKSGVVPFHATHYIEAHFTKRDAFVALNMDNNLARYTAQMYSGVLALRVTEYTRYFTHEWFSLCSNPQLLLADLPSRKQEREMLWKHKEDQSILSLLVKRENIKSFPMPTFHRDRGDILAIEAGYCDPGVDSEVIVYGGWSGKTDADWYASVKQKVPEKVHGDLGWLNAANRSFMRYWLERSQENRIRLLT